MAQSPQVFSPNVGLIPPADLLYALLRIVSCQLPDGRLVRVLTDRFDLSALSIARLYKERWKIENWWKWIKAMLKIKEPLGERQNALQIQIVAAFVTDLLWRAFQTFGGFRGTLYEFVTRCQELSLVRITDLWTGYSVGRWRQS